MEEEFLQRKSRMIQTSSNLVELCDKALSMVRKQKQELLDRIPDKTNTEALIRCMKDELYYEALRKEFRNIKKALFQLTC